MAANVLKFMTRRTQLRLREARTIAQRVNRFGQYLLPSPAEAERLRLEQLEHRRQDLAWSERHGLTEEGGVVVLFRNDSVVELTPCDRAEGRQEVDTGAADA